MAWLFNLWQLATQVPIENTLMVIGMLHWRTKPMLLNMFFRIWKSMNTIGSSDWCAFASPNVIFLASLPNPIFVEILLMHTKKKLLTVVFRHRRSVFAEYPVSVMNDRLLVTNRNPLSESQPLSRCFSQLPVWLKLCGPGNLEPSSSKHGPWWKPQGDVEHHEILQR